MAKVYVGGRRVKKAENLFTQSDIKKIVDYALKNQQTQYVTRRWRSINAQRRINRI